MRRNVNVLIFLDVNKALNGTAEPSFIFICIIPMISNACFLLKHCISDGMKLYMSDNKVILTEGFDGVVAVKYFQKIESWPNRQPIPF